MSRLRLNYGSDDGEKLKFSICTYIYLYKITEKKILILPSNCLIFFVANNRAFPAADLKYPNTSSVTSLFCCKKKLKIWNKI